MPKFRPNTCSECPLCGVRPKEELTEGSKWTHKCMLDDRILSGRGTKQPNARNRCSHKIYEKQYFTYQGEFPISPTRMERYGIAQTKLVYPR